MAMAVTAWGTAPMATPPASAASTTSTMAATADTYLDAAATSTNYGRASTLRFSQTSSRVLLKFHLGLPVGSRITSVKLRIYSNTTVNGNVVVHPASSQWEKPPPRGMTNRPGRPPSSLGQWHSARTNTSTSHYR